MEIEEEAAPLGGAEAAPAEEFATPAVKVYVEVSVEIAEVVANAVKEIVTMMKEAAVTPAVGEAPAAVAPVKAPAAPVAEAEAAPAGAQVPAAAASAGIIEHDPYLIIGAGTSPIAALRASIRKCDWCGQVDHTSSHCTSYDKVQQHVLDKLGRGASTRRCTWCGLNDHTSYLCNLYDKVRHHVLNKQSRGGGNSNRGASYEVGEDNPSPASGVEVNEEDFLEGREN